MTTIRLSLELTQIEMADLIKVSQSLIVKYEKNVLLPGLDQWFYFCAITNTPYERFWDFYEKPEPQFPKTQKII